MTHEHELLKGGAQSCAFCDSVVHGGVVNVDIALLNLTIGITG